jgi:hypothetical protein
LHERIHRIFGKTQISQQNSSFFRGILIYDHSQTLFEAFGDKFQPDSLIFRLLSEEVLGICFSGFDRLTVDEIFEKIGNLASSGY